MYKTISVSLTQTKSTHTQSKLNTNHKKKNLFNLLPDDKILDTSKLKRSADNNS